MPDLSQIRNFNLKIIFLVHFVFISLSCMGNWVGTAFIFYNGVYIIFLIWSLYHDQSHEPLQLAIAVNFVSVILDILLLIMGFPGNRYARETFSAAMAILHLIIRPFSAVLLIRNLEERSGSSGILTGILSGRSETYEDIDRSSQPQTSASHAAAGYDFSSAQQI